MKYMADLQANWRQPELLTYSACCPRQGQQYAISAQRRIFLNLRSISLHYLRSTRRSLRLIIRALPLLLAEVRTLNFPNKECDCIFCTKVFEHIPDGEKHGIKTSALQATNRDRCTGRARHLCRPNGKRPTRFRWLSWTLRGTLGELMIKAFIVSTGTSAADATARQLDSPGSFRQRTASLVTRSI